MNVRSSRYRIPKFVFHVKNQHGKWNQLFLFQSWKFRYIINRTAHFWNKWFVVYFFSFKNCVELLILIRSSRWIELFSSIIVYEFNDVNYRKPVVNYQMIIVVHFQRQRKKLNICCCAMHVLLGGKLVAKPNLGQK